MWPGEGVSILYLFSKNQLLVWLIFPYCLCVCSVVSASLWPCGLQPPRFLCPWDFPGKNTEVGCHFFLQGIFLTQGLDSYLLNWQADSLQLSHQGFSLFTGLRESLCALVMLKNVVFFFVLKVGTHHASYLVISFTIAVDSAHPHVISCQVQRSEM